MVRLLVADGSQLMVRLVQRLVPNDVEVIDVQRLADAREVLATDPPDAAILTVAPSHGDLSELVGLCGSHVPPVPFLLCSTLDRDPPMERSLPDPAVAVLTKPVRLCDLRHALAQLLSAAGARPR